MKILGIDVGSSSVKAGVLSNGEPAGKLVRAAFDTTYSGVRVEVDADEVVRAIRSAIKDLGPATRNVDAIGLTVMAPSWVALDAKGKALTPIVTHQDRRSVDVAKRLEAPADPTPGDGTGTPADPVEDPEPRGVDTTPLRLRHLALATTLRESEI